MYIEPEESPESSKLLPTALRVVGARYPWRCRPPAGLHGNQPRNVPIQKFSAPAKGDPSFRIYLYIPTYNI